MTSDNHQIVRCQCSAKLRVPAAAAGRKVACPKCGFKILVGAPAGASSSSPPPVPAPSPPADEDNLLDDLLSAEASSETAQGPDLADHQKTCPKCKAQMTKDARVCLSCGSDPAIVGNTTVKKQKKARNAGKQAMGVGRFVLGCVFSAGGVLFASGLWYVVEMFGVKLGIIAWLVGLLAGLGMKYGYGQQNMRGAIAATVMAAIGILSAKGMIYMSLVFVSAVLDVVDSPALVVSHRASLRCGYEEDLKGYSPYSEKRTRDCDSEISKYFDMEEAELAEARQEIDQWYETDRWADTEYVKTRLIYLYAEEMPAYGDDVGFNDKNWEWDEAKAESDWQRRYNAARQKVEALPEGQWAATAKNMEKAGDWQAELFEGDDEFDEDIEELKDQFGEDSSFFSAMFGPIDLLFILLALGTAIKVAGGHEG